MKIEEMRRLPANRRIVLPIDMVDMETGMRLAKAVQKHIWGVKLGFIPLMAHGVKVIGSFKEAGFRVMADPKFNDIPNTVGAAARLVRNAGADLCTMHASMGVPGMKAVVEACGDDTLAIAVTVLTSRDADSCKKVFRLSPEDAAANLANLALVDSGAHGIVCSPADLPYLSTRIVGFHNRLFITPAVRPAGADADDHARVATPGQAIKNGATLLVIGRAISTADPVASAQKIVAEIEEALS